MRKKRKGGNWITDGLVPIYKIVKSLGKGLYSLKGVEDSGRVIERVHGTRLKPYLSPLQSITPNVR